MNVNQDVSHTMLGTGGDEKNDSGLNVWVNIMKCLSCTNLNELNDDKFI